MEIKMYLQMLKRGWWLIALCTLSALAASLTMSYISEPTYMATSRFLVSPDAYLSQYAGDVINSINTLDKRSIVTTYSAVLSSDTIYEQALNDLNLSPDLVAGYKRSAVVLPESNVLEISVEGSNPQLIMLLANSIGKQAIAYIDGLNQGFNLRILDAAQLPAAPISPQPVRDASLAIAFGLVLGAALAIIREQLIAPIEAFMRRNNTDPDSGVSSRQYFDHKMDEILVRSPLIGFHSLGLVHLEGLDNYIGVIPKPIEQQILRQVAKILRNELRGNDLVGRWDATTFAVLLPGTPGKAASITLSRVQTMLTSPVTLGESETLLLNPRVGLAERQDNELPEVLREQAEDAIKQAIAGGLSLVFYKTER